MRVQARVLARSVGCWAAFQGLLAHILPSRTHLCHQRSSCEGDIGQRKCRERPRGVLGQATVARFVESRQPLDHAEDMVDAGANARLVAIVRTLGLVNFTHVVSESVGGLPSNCKKQRALRDAGQPDVGRRRLLGRGEGKRLFFALSKPALPCSDKPSRILGKETMHICGCELPCALSISSWQASLFTT